MKPAVQPSRHWQPQHGRKTWYGCTEIFLPHEMLFHPSTKHNYRPKETRVSGYSESSVWRSAVRLSVYLQSTGSQGSRASICLWSASMYRPACRCHACYARNGGQIGSDLGCNADSARGTRHYATSASPVCHKCLITGLFKVPMVLDSCVCLQMWHIGATSDQFNG